MPSGQADRVLGVGVGAAVDEDGGDLRVAFAAGVVEGSPSSLTEAR